MLQRRRARSEKAVLEADCQRSHTKDIKEDRDPGLRERKRASFS